MKDEQHDNMPFGIEEEQRLERIEAEGRDRRSIIAELREEIRRYEQAALRRRERRRPEREKSQ